MKVTIITLYKVVINVVLIGDVKISTENEDDLERYRTS